MATMEGEFQEVDSLFSLIEPDYFAYFVFSDPLEETKKIGEQIRHLSATDSVIRSFTLVHFLLWRRRHNLSTLNSIFSLQLSESTLNPFQVNQAKITQILPHQEDFIRELRVP